MRGASATNVLTKTSPPLIQMVPSSESGFISPWMICSSSFVGGYADEFLERGNPVCSGAHLMEFLIHFDAHLVRARGMVFAVFFDQFLLFLFEALDIAELFRNFLFDFFNLFLLIFFCHFLTSFVDYSTVNWLNVHICMHTCVHKGKKNPPTATVVRRSVSGYNWSIRILTTTGFTSNTSANSRTLSACRSGPTLHTKSSLHCQIRLNRNVNQVFRHQQASHGFICLKFPPFAAVLSSRNLLIAAQHLGFLGITEVPEQRPFIRLQRKKMVWSNP